MKTKTVIFCRVASMEYYRGNTEKDRPVNGGSHVDLTGEAHECYNFDPVNIDGEDVCLGFVMIARTSSTGNMTLHLEKMNGCELAKNLESVDGVTVVWCAKGEGCTSTRVVGFYKNATAYRYPQFCDFESGYCQQYNFVAKKEDCVLLPINERYTKSEWYVPMSGKNGYEFGFGRSNIWFANGENGSLKERDYVERVLEAIENYSGRNLMEEE